MFLLFILYLYPYNFDLFYILWPFVVPVVDYTNMKINEMEWNCWLLKLWFPELSKTPYMTGGK